MQTTPRRSLLGLFGLLTGEARTLFRQEVQLAKTEISEKLSSMGRHAAGLAVGGFVAYAGLIVFLISLGWLLGWAFRAAGLEPALATFLGMAIVGLVVSLVGGLLLFRGIKTLSRESLKPQRTLQTLQELKGGKAFSPSHEATQLKPAASSQEIQQRVEETEDRLGETLGELGERLSPQHINAQVKGRIQANPLRSGLMAMGAGLLSALLLKRRFRRA